MMSHLARHGLLAERADEAVAVPVSALEGDEPANKQGVMNTQDILHYRDTWCRPGR